jgi:hypothetical protein
LAEARILNNAFESQPSSGVKIEDNCMQIQVFEEADPPGADDVTAGLRAHMIEQTGNLPRVPLTLLIRDEDHQVRGGIRANVVLCWL